MDFNCIHNVLFPRDKANMAKYWYDYHWLLIMFISFSLFFVRLNTSEYLNISTFLKNYQNGQAIGKYVLYGKQIPQSEELLQITKKQITWTSSF